MFWLIFGVGLIVLLGCAYSNASRDKKTQNLKARPIGDLFGVNIRNISDLVPSVRGGGIDHEDFVCQLDKPEWGTFDRLIVRTFQGENNHYTLRFECTTGRIDKDFVVNISTLCRKMGADDSGMGFPSSEEFDKIRSGRYWLGRRWSDKVAIHKFDDENLSLTIYDVNC